METTAAEEETVPQPRAFPSDNGTLTTMTEGMAAMNMDSFLETLIRETKVAYENKKDFSMEDAYKLMKSSSNDLMDMLHNDNDNATLQSSTVDVGLNCNTRQESDIMSMPSLPFASQIRPPDDDDDSATRKPPYKKKKQITQEYV